MVHLPGFCVMPNLLTRGESFTDATENVTCPACLDAIKAAEHRVQADEFCSCSGLVAVTVETVLAAPNICTACGKTRR